MKKSFRFIIVCIILCAIGAGVRFLLPVALQSAGLHADYEKHEFSFDGMKALIITTSHDTLGDSGKPTGVFASEMTIPYYDFIEAGLEVDVASILGGEIPIDPDSFRFFTITTADKRYRNDAAFLAKTQRSIKIDDVDFLEYDLIYIAGGWGAAYDIGQSKVLGDKISQAFQAGKILGSTCHGALAFIQAQDANGIPLTYQRQMTGVTNKQLIELRIYDTPLHPETELRRGGAVYQCETKRLDIFASCIVVDGTIVTGQNQNDGGPVAQAMMQLLNEMKLNETP